MKRYNRVENKKIRQIQKTADLTGGHMKQTKKLISVFLILLVLLSGCSKKEEETAAPETVEENTETQVKEEVKEEEKTEEDVLLNFDPLVYPNTDSDDLLNVLLYATNNTDKIMFVTVSYQAFDSDGNVIAAYDQFTDQSKEKSKVELFVPANVKDFPMAFILPMGYRFNIKENTYMPEIDHIDYEIKDKAVFDYMDLKEHFEADEAQIKNDHIYQYLGFDQEISDNYESLYMNYTILGYKGGRVSAVICGNDYPGGTSSRSVSNAKESEEGKILLYHDVYGQDVDEWKLFLGCVAGN